MLTRLRPDTVLLMEGSNDLFSQTTVSDLMGVAIVIEGLVLEAKRQGVDVMLATIPPQRGTAQRFAPPVLSDFLRDVADRQNVPLVDIYTLLNEARCATVGSSALPTLRFPTLRSPWLTQGACIGDDGLHPTAEGYDLIADEFLRRILEVYGVGGFSPSSSRVRALVGSRGY